VHARQVFDSRGRPTVEADVELEDGSLGRAIVPSGASTGQHEAHELRDRDRTPYGGLGVLRAVENVDAVIAPAVVGFDATDQASLDSRLRELDGTPNLQRLGANAVLAVSMANARAAAISAKAPLYRYLATDDDPVLPLPMVNVLSGGAHARGGMDVQDFLAIAVGAESLDQALAWTWHVRAAAGALLADEGRSLLLADEGGFSPGYATAAEALELMVRAIERAGLQPGQDVAIAMDVAATQLFRADGVYELLREERTLTSDEMIQRTQDWLDRFPIVSIEDPLAEDDWSAWQLLTSRIGDRCQLVGDDLFCTNPTRLRRGVDARAANAVLIKLNQIGTVSDTLSTVKLARDSGYAAIVSARSGETEDSFIADLAVATGCGQIKVGSLSSSERMAKYNQLLRIQEDLGAAFTPLGAHLRARWRTAPQ
jgi:enolase